MTYTEHVTHDLTLPISIEKGISMDSVEAKNFGLMLAHEYISASPFPHIVIDNFLPLELIEKIAQHFPKEKLKNDSFYETGYTGHHKRQIMPYDCDEYAMNKLLFLNSAPVLQFLEGLTSIEGLISDPYYSGGGFHEIRRGGQLGIHADFRINPQLHLERRLNMLIYLNKEWNPNWGGYLEIWDKKMTKIQRSIAPLFNRCVIFNTDTDTFHGHPDPLNCPDDVTRKSIALYYYTASKSVYSESPAHPTMYMARQQDSGNVKRHVLKYRLKSHLVDCLPPILVRNVRAGLKSLKLKLRPLRKKYRN